MNSIERTLISERSLKVETLICCPFVMLRKTPFMKKRNVSMSRN